MKRRRFRIASVLFGVTILFGFSCSSPVGTGTNDDNSPAAGDSADDVIAMGSTSIDVADGLTLALSGDTLWSNGANIDSNNDRWFITVTDPAGATLDITIIRGRDPGDPFADVPDNFTFDLSNASDSVDTPGEQAMELTFETAGGTQYTSLSGATGSAVLTIDPNLNEWSITLDAENLEEVGASGTPGTIDLDGTISAVPSDGLITADVDGIELSGLLVTDMNLVDGALDLQFSNGDVVVYLSMGYDPSAPFEYATGTFQLSDPIVESIYMVVDPDGSSDLLSGAALVDISAANSSDGRVSGAILLTGLDSGDVIGADTGDDSFTLTLYFVGALVE